MSSLESLSRKELQTLAKSHGLKANSSSAELIRELNLLLDKNEAVTDSIVIADDKNSNKSKEDYHNVNSIIEVLIDKDWQKATVKRVNKKTKRIVLFGSTTELTVNIENTRVMEQTEEPILEKISLIEIEIPKSENDTINVDEILNDSSPTLKKHRRRKVKDSFNSKQHNDNLESNPQSNPNCAHKTPELTVESITKIPKIVFNDIPIVVNNDNHDIVVNNDNHDNVVNNDNQDNDVNNDNDIDTQTITHDVVVQNDIPTIVVQNDIHTTDVEIEQCPDTLKVIDKVEINLPLNNINSNKINISNNLLPKNIPRMNNSQRLRMEAMQTKLSMIDSQNQIRSSTPIAFTSNTPPLRSAIITSQQKNSRQSVLSVKKTPILSTSVRQSTSGGFESFIGKRKTLDESDKSKYSAPDFKRMHSKQFSGLKSIAECVDKVI